MVFADLCADVARDFHRMMEFLIKGPRREGRVFARRSDVWIDPGERPFMWRDPADSFVRLDGTRFLPGDITEDSTVISTGHFD